MNIPQEFFDPIMQEVMRDPVFALCGHTFERSSLEEWFLTNGTCPLRCQLGSKLIRPNYALRGAIEAFVKERPELVLREVQQSDFEMAVKMYAQEMNQRVAQLAAKMNGEVDTALFFDSMPEPPTKTNNAHNTNLTIREIESEVSQWLRQIKLEQYIEVFKREGFELLEDLNGISKEDFDAMEIKRGHRRRLLNNLHSGQASLLSRAWDNNSGQNDMKSYADSQSLDSANDHPIPDPDRSRATSGASTTNNADSRSRATSGASSTKFEATPTPDCWIPSGCSSNQGSRRPSQDLGEEKGDQKLHTSQTPRGKTYMELMSDGASITGEDLTTIDRRFKPSWSVWEAGYRHFEHINKTKEGQYGLGWCLEHGKGLPDGGGRNLNLAISWYQKAAADGHCKALTCLGRLYQNGKGVGETNTEKAVAYYRDAAAQGDARAQTHLGECFEAGLGVPVDANKAVQMYTLAARQGHPHAQTFLGLCYQNGIGVVQNEAVASALFQKATGQGYKLARNCLQKLQAKHPALSSSSSSSSSVFSGLEFLDI